MITMKLLAISILLLGACGDDESMTPTVDASLHEKQDCSDVWGSRHTCETPCADEVHENAQGQSPQSSCTGTAGAETWKCFEGSATVPSSVFEYMGVRGCCAKRSTHDPEPNGYTVYFVACD